VAAGLSGKRLGRHLSSAALLAGYALHPFVESRNHWAVFEAWVMVAAHTLAVAERHAVDEQWWEESFDLSFGAALTAIEGLIEEASARLHLLEGEVLVDSFVYKARMTVTSGMMAAYSLIRRLQGKTHPYGDKIRAFVLAHCEEMDLWGESAVPWMLMVAWYLEDCGRPLDAEGIWNVIGYALATSNKRHGPEPRRLMSIPDPYLGAEGALGRRIGVPTDDTIEEASYVGHAFTLKSVITLLARRMRRQALARLWYDVTDVAMAEMYPDPKWAWLLWRSQGGGPRETWAKRPESWATLRREAEATDTSDLPALAVVRPDFLLAFLCTYPHRVRTDVVKLLDSAL
jgi:hypothetical protein